MNKLLYILVVLAPFLANSVQAAVLWDEAVNGSIDDRIFYLSGGENTVSGTVNNVSTETASTINDIFGFAVPAGLVVNSIILDYVFETDSSYDYIIQLVLWPSTYPGMYMDFDDVHVNNPSSGSVVIFSEDKPVYRNLYGGSRNELYPIPEGIHKLHIGDGLAGSTLNYSITFNAIPLPASAWLLLSALASLLGYKKLKL